MRVLLGDPDVVCGTNTKGEVCLSGGACTALSGPLGGHLALTAQEHEALSMLRMACSMHLSQRALLRMPRRCTRGRRALGHCRSVYRRRLAVLRARRASLTALSMKNKRTWTRNEGGF